MRDESQKKESQECEETHFPVDFLPIFMLSIRSKITTAYEAK